MSMRNNCYPLQQDDDYSIILDCDAYKAAHWITYPPNTSKIFSYVESRGGMYPVSMFFGLQYYLMKYLSRPINERQVWEAKEEWELMGEPFNLDGWMYIIEKHDGYLPLEIHAVPEGTVCPISNLLSSVINTDPDCHWLTSYGEPPFLRGNWYGTTVGTRSWWIKQMLKFYMNRSCNDLSKLPYMLHDFGTRGVSSYESCQISGAAHLVNFLGTDNMPAVRFLRKWYKGKGSIGQSIRAGEHSSVITWGRGREAASYANLVEQFKGHMFACPIDSYDMHNGARLWGRLKNRIMETNTILVMRPDSGVPLESVSDVTEIAFEDWGGDNNRKGYRLLNPHVRLIQGDGVHESSIEGIAEHYMDTITSMDNICFGMGGKLLQADIDRDTMEWAMKPSASEVDGVWIDNFKIAPGKNSKRGVLTLYRDRKTGAYITQRIVPGAEKYYDVVPRLVYRNGILYNTMDLEEIRDNSNKHSYSWLQLKSMRDDMQDPTFHKSAVLNQ